MQFVRFLILILGAAALLGCSWFTGEEYRAQWPEPRPLGADLAGNPQVSSAKGEPGAEDGDVALPEPDGPLTLRDALAMALRGHPALGAAAREVSAREAEALQAGLPPNPELEFELENVLGGRVTVREDGEESVEDLGGFGVAKGTLYLGQLVELGGKRSKRRRLAEAQSDLAAWDYEALRLGIITEVRVAFVEALAAQEKVDLAERLTEVAEKAVETVTLRVEAGKVSALEAGRATVALEALRAALDGEKHRLVAARRGLAATWGSQGGTTPSVTGALERLRPPGSLESLFVILEENPELARRETQAAALSAALKLARANAIPDIEIGAGVKRVNETDNHSFLFGLSIPIPFSNRNQGAIRAAKERRAGAEDETRATRRKLRAELADVYGELAAAYSTARRLGDKALPLARRVYEDTLEGYERGKFGLTNVLDAQRAFFVLRAKYLKSLAEYHTAMAEMEGLLGRPLETMEEDHE